MAHGKKLLDSDWPRDHEFIRNLKGNSVICRKRLISLKGKNL